MNTMEKQESIKPLRNGVPHLHKGAYVRVYANLAQATKAAVRTGGIAYKSILSSRFMVRFSV